MAVFGTNPILGRIVDALGLGLCRGFTLKASVDDVARIQAEQYATAEQLDDLATAMETKDYYLVSQYDWKQAAELRTVVRSLLDHVNAKHPDKNPREWTCPHMARLDQLVPPVPVCDDTKEVT